jgi:hypothetical protein
MEKSPTNSQGILWKVVLLKVHLTRIVIRSCTTSRLSTPVTIGIADRWEKVCGTQCSSISHNRKLKLQAVNTGFQFV